jgi:hypothetical protein
LKTTLTGRSSYLKATYSDKEKAVSVVNLYKTTCPECGVPTDEIISGNIFYTKLPSGQTIYVQHNEKHQARNFLVKEKLLSEFVVLSWIPVAAGVRVPGKTMCEKCEAHRQHIQGMQEEVEAGGVAWRCTDCGNTGVVEADYDFAKDVREQAGIKPPDMCALSYEKCSAHEEVGIKECLGTDCGKVTMIYEDDLCAECYEAQEEPEGDAA